MEPTALADGARLLHVGFRKCGTTALQAALQRARVPLAALGVIYPGRTGNQTPAALAVTGRTHGWTTLGAKPQPMDKWNALVEEVAGLAPTQRAIISSEFFDVADSSTIRTVVAGLGGDQLRVVVTARPLARVLPSAWQQQVKVGMRSNYSTWLRDVLDHDETQTHQAFWERHGQAGVLSRWAGVVGPERVTLVVLDELDRGLPYRSFETMLGIPHGTLEELPDQANRSLTGAEAELIRRVNVEVLSGDVTWDEYTRWISRGAALRLVSERTPGPDEPPTHTPLWALERASDISAGFVSDIETLGVEVIGDLRSLAAMPTPIGPEVEEADPELIPIDAAVLAVIGSGYSARQRATRPVPVPRPPVAPLTGMGRPAPTALRSRDLASLLARRVGRRLRRTLRRVGAIHIAGS